MILFLCSINHCRAQQSDLLAGGITITNDLVNFSVTYSKKPYSYFRTATISYFIDSIIVEFYMRPRRLDNFPVAVPLDSSVTVKDSFLNQRCGYRATVWWDTVIGDTNKFGLQYHYNPKFELDTSIIYSTNNCAPLANLTGIKKALEYQWQPNNQLQLLGLNPIDKVKIKMFNIYGQMVWEANYKNEPLPIPYQALSVIFVYFDGAPCLRLRQ
jgi:hypothetical protein